MDHTPYSLSGKTVLVTGASSGIGRAVAILCSKMDATVIITARNGARLQETLSLMDNPGRHTILQGDLILQNDVESIAEQIPTLNGICHCAGIAHTKLCKQIDNEDIDYVMNANFKAPVFLQTAILKKKKIQKGGSIVFIASLAAVAPDIGNAMYCASKGALVSYSNCLGLELSARQIRVNTIEPAMVWTDFVFKSGALTEEMLKEDEQKYPLKRYGKPEDIANLAVYLLSDASSWMTMNNIPISGGRHSF